jgi:hypothetical protein
MNNNRTVERNREKKEGKKRWKNEFKMNRCMYISKPSAAAKIKMCNGPERFYG